MIRLLEACLIGVVIGGAVSAIVWPPRERMIPPRFLLCDCSRGTVVHQPGLTCGCDESSRSTF